VYYIDIPNIKYSILSVIYLRFINSSGVVSTSTYDYAALEMKSSAAFAEQRGTNSSVSSHLTITENTTGVGISLMVYNPYDSSSYTFTQSQSAGRFTNLFGYKTISVEKTAQQITGISFLGSGGTLNEIDVSVYGVK